MKAAGIDSTPTPGATVSERARPTKPRVLVVDDEVGSATSCAATWRRKGSRSSPPPTGSKRSTSHAIGVPTGGARRDDARHRRPRGAASSPHGVRRLRDHADRARPTRSTSSSGSRSGPTTTSRSHSARASSSLASSGAAPGLEAAGPEAASASSSTASRSTRRAARSTRDGERVDAERARVRPARRARACARAGVHAGQLLEQVWGSDFYGDERVVDVHIRSIRQRSVTAPRSRR